MKPVVVLVIDDDAAHADATAEIVQRAGYLAKTAYSGTAGIEALHAGGVDIVVTDLVMRDRSGLDVIAAASEGEAAERPRVVVVTGYGSPEA
ncbi:MAG: response regulator, partial [Planctomycetota bacterium]